MQQLQKNNSFLKCVKAKKSIKTQCGNKGKIQSVSPLSSPIRVGVTYGLAGGVGGEGEGCSEPGLKTQNVGSHLKRSGKNGITIGAEKK